MSRVLVSLLLLCPLPALAAAPPAVAPPVFDAQGRTIGPPLSERVVDYEIDARLDPATRTLTGRETITWRNRSAEPQATLWFHLYWNAFKNDRSTFFRDARRMRGIPYEDANDADFPRREKEDWGFSEVEVIRVQGGADLLPTLRYEHPDDDNAEDQTVFTVTLPEPVPPGGRVTLEVHWVSRVPKAVLRAGHADGYYLIAQWFPKLGVLEIPPERGLDRPRWNCHQYHASSEFYADFGTYDVRVTVPRAMKVGATGVLVERRENPDGTVTHRFHQDDVHDFAWTASERFEVLEDVFREPDMPEVRLTVLLDPKHRRSGPQILQAVKASLGHFGRWWFPFPYPHLTLVAPPAEGLPTGAMEYPTFITVLAREEPGEPKDFFIWRLVAHELAHNYWQGMVASNEFEEAWLDEGITSYVTWKLCAAEGVQIWPEQILPEPLRQVLGRLVALEVDAYDQMRVLAPPRPSAPIVLPAWLYRTRQDYGFNSYGRPQVTLYALEQLVGEETMARILRAYAQRWRFRHPGSEDFFAVASEVSGRDLRWFWDEYFRGTRGLDYAVGALSCTERDRAEKAGIFDGQGGRVVLDRRESVQGAGGARVNRCEVEVHRLGDARYPAEVEVTFGDGSRRTERWDGQDRWQRWVYEREGPGAQVERVEVVRNGLLALDANPANNSRTRSISGHVTVALFGWTTYLGQLLATFASVLL